MRQGRQPGPALQPRRLSLPAESAGEYRLVLAKGSELHRDLLSAAADLRIGRATVTLLSGDFERFSYLTGQPDDSGERLATYGAPTSPPGPVTMIGANGLIGADPAGAPLLHCHALAVDAEGEVHGGHLPPDACIVGEQGLTLRLLALTGSGFQVAYDAETNYAIFQPATWEQPQ